jgi:hypothetical protein
MGWGVRVWRAHGLLAWRLGVEPRTLWRYVNGLDGGSRPTGMFSRSGELCPARVCRGSRLMVPVDEAQAWVERNLLRAEAKPAVRVPVATGGRGGRPLRSALAELEASEKEAA